MPTCDSKFQVASEQRAILRQALLYKKQWDADSRQNSVANYARSLTPCQIDKLNDEVSEEIQKTRSSNREGMLLPALSLRSGKAKPNATTGCSSTLPPMSGLRSNEVPSLYSSQLSHHAVSSVCKDTDISRFSQRVQALERKLQEEEALRRAVTEELKEIKKLLPLNSQKPRRR